MDFALAFAFPFEDEEWIKKIAIAAVLCLTIIGIIPVFGWSLVVTRRVINGEAPTLPDWTDFADYIVLAIKGIVVAIVFSLPLLIVIVPVSVATTLIETQSTELATVVTLVNVCLSCVSFLYSILLAFAIPAAYGQLAATGSIGAALNVGKIVAMLRAVPSAYLITVLGLIAAGFVASLGVVLCVVGVFATIAYSMAVEGHLYGQAYRQAAAQGAV